MCELDVEICVVKDNERDVERELTPRVELVDVEALDDEDPCEFELNVGVAEDEDDKLRDIDCEMLLLDEVELRAVDEEIPTADDDDLPEVDIEVSKEDDELRNIEVDVPEVEVLREVVMDLVEDGEL